MRTFIAIELPKEIKNKLGVFQGQLKSSGADVKWVEPQNIHLTLKFLGEVEEKKIGEINKIIKAVADTSPPFHIKISSIGAFPKIDSPRVIWLGIEAGDKETGEIFKGLEDGLVKIKIPKENRPFSSHITLGRTRSSLNKEKLIQQLGEIETKIGRENLEFLATKITLFKSTLTPKGPIYEILAENTLKTA